VFNGAAEVRMLVPRRGGAFSAVLVAAVLTGACSSTASQPTVPSRADEVLAANIHAALNADPVYFFRHVDVTVEDGVADLSGYVWSTDAIYRARTIARAVSGVRRVVTSHLELERNGLRNDRGR
jgi:osmotically-inducible protein OsmY